jgi:hypothetical protein
MTAFGASILPENKQAVTVKKHLVALTDAGHEALLALAKKGWAATGKLTRVHRMACQWQARLRQNHRPKSDQGVLLQAVSTVTAVAADDEGV